MYNVRYSRSSGEEDISLSREKVENCGTKLFKFIVYHAQSHRTQVEKGRDKEKVSICKYKPLGQFQLLFAPPPPFYWMSIVTANTLPAVSSLTTPFCPRLSCLSTLLSFFHPPNSATDFVRKRTRFQPSFIIFGWTVFFRTLHISSA